MTLSPADAVVGWLPQEPERRPGEDVAGHLARRTGVAAAQAALDAAADALGAGRPRGRRRLRARVRPVDGPRRGRPRGAHGAGARRPRACDLDVAHPMTGLSGGQAARVGLAALLLSRFDVLLLDEPTNDLDLDGLARLEAFVRAQRAGIVVVSHDREFLARVRDERRRARPGPAAGQRVRRRATTPTSRSGQIARRHAREAYEEYADRRSSLEERGRTQRGWMDKGVRNAIRKGDPDKNIRHHQREGSEKQAAKARQTDRMIERLEEVAEPRKEWELRYEIAAAPRGSAVVATLRDAVVRRGDFTLGPVDLQRRRGRPRRGDRRQRVGQDDPARRAARPGAARRRARVARLERRRRRGGPGARACLDTPLPLREAFAAEVPDWPDAEVRTLLAKFGLRAAHVLRPGRVAVPGRADPGGARAAAGPRGQPAGARRADQPPRPAGDRAARGGARRLHRHAAAGHPRPPHARRGAASTVAGSSTPAPSARCDRTARPVSPSADRAGQSLVRNRSVAGDRARVVGQQDRDAVPHGVGQRVGPGRSRRSSGSPSGPTPSTRVAPVTGQRRMSRSQGSSDGRRPGSRRGRPSRRCPRRTRPSRR